MTKAVNCSFYFMGDGRCDEINNKEECNYDEGDCCQFECNQNCNAKLKKNYRCPYECGSNFFNCKISEKCQKCVHGTCKNINECFKSDDSVLKSIDNCKYNTISMGNSRTIEYHCGKDPNLTVIHYLTDMVIIKNYILIF